MKHFLIRHSVLVIICIYVLTIILLVIANGGLLFEKILLERVGDQQLYYELGLALAKLDSIKSQYTIGYSLLYVPFIVLTGFSSDWRSIMNPLIIFQAFMLIPLCLWMILSTKRLRYQLATPAIGALLILFYATSKDPLTVYNAFGLVPLSEPLTSFLLVAIYYVYLRFPQFKYSMVLIGALIAWCAMTRQTSAILVAPIFIDLLWQKRWAQFLQLAISSAVFFMPQIVYNLKVSGQLYFNSYQWWADRRIERNNQLKQGVFGFTDPAIFSFKYFTKAISLMLLRYLPFLAFGGVVWATAPWRQHRLLLLVLGASVVNLLFHLTYWWSAAGDLLDRFLLPNMFLLLFMFGNRLLAKPKV